MSDLTQEEIDYILSSFRKLFTIRDLLGASDIKKIREKHEIEQSIILKLCK